MSSRPKELTTVREVKAALGGNNAVAKIAGVKRTAAVNWGNPDLQPLFPSNTYLVMREALAAIGKSAPPELWGMKTGDQS